MNGARGSWGWLIGWHVSELARDLRRETSSELDMKLRNLVRVMLLYQSSSTRMGKFCILIPESKTFKSLHLTDF